MNKFKLKKGASYDCSKGKEISFENPVSSELTFDNARTKGMQNLGPEYSSQSSQNQVTVL